MQKLTHFFVFASLFGLMSCVSLLDYPVEDVIKIKDRTIAVLPFKVLPFEDLTETAGHPRTGPSSNFVLLEDIPYTHNDRRNYLKGLSNDFAAMMETHLAESGLNLKSKDPVYFIEGKINHFEAYVEYNKKLDDSMKAIAFWGGPVGARIAGSSKKLPPLKKILNVEFDISVRKRDTVFFTKKYYTNEIGTVKFLDDSGAYSYANEAMKSLINRFVVDLRTAPFE